MKLVKKYLKSRSGVTAVEYGLIAGGVSLAITAVIFMLGDSLESIITALNDWLGQVNSSM